MRISWKSVMGPGLTCDFGEDADLFGIDAEEERLIEEIRDAVHSVSNLLDDIVPATPDGVHGELLVERHAGSGEIVSQIILWADRAIDRCPRCGQPVDRAVYCPAVLESTGRTVDVDPRHSCGEWLPVRWVGLPADASPDETAAAAADLATRRNEELAEEIARREERLRRDA